MSINLCIVLWDLTLMLLGQPLSFLQKIFFIKIGRNDLVVSVSRG